MSPIQSLAVCVRLFSIWLFWYGLTTASGTYFSARNANQDTSLLVFAVAAIFVTGICLFLWLFPTLLARKILPKQADVQNDVPLFENWFSVGCSLLGVLSLAKAIPALFSYLIVNYLGQKMYPGVYTVNPDWPLLFTFNVLQVLFGAWLFLGAKGLRKILVWAREE